MIGFALKHLAARLLAGVLITAVAGVVLSGAWRDYLANLGPDGAKQRQLERKERRAERDARRALRRAGKAAKDARRRLDPARTTEHALSEGASVRSRIAARVWRVIRLPAAVLALLAAALSISRIRARRQRRYRRYWLLPYRGDEATPEQVTDLFESWHQQLLERWWRRLLYGQPSFAVEAHAIPDKGGSRVLYTLVLPDDDHLLRAFDGRLIACYRDSRLLETDGAPAWYEAVLRLKKRYGLLRRLKTVERYEQPLADGLVSTMAAMGEGVTVQYVLTPTPALFDRVCRWMFRRHEDERERDRLKRNGDPGRDSEVVEQELRGGLELQHHPLMFCELRVAAASYRTATAVAGTIRGGSNSENRLVERYMRRRGRARLYARRIAAAVGNPLPSWNKGVISTSELAGLCHLPSPFLKGVRLERSSLPRVPAPPEIRRTGRDGALGRDANGYVGLHDRDKPMNLAVIGLQGSGKSSVLRAGIQADAEDRSCVPIVLDPKGDLYAKALSAIPADRRVHFIDFANPEVGIDPFRANADHGVVADGIVEAFKEIMREGSIQEASERYLLDAALAVAAAEDEPTLWDMYRLLLPDEDDYRAWVVSQIDQDPALVATATFFGKQLPAQLAGAKNAFLPRLDAPANKIQKLLRPDADRLLRHPVKLDIDEAIRNRDCIVVNGASGAEETTKVVMQFILHLVHRALIRQQRRPEHERTRVALYVDEAHVLFSPTFARMLAMDRSSGLTCTAAWQSLAQVEDLNVRAQILDLLRSYCIFAVGKDDARELARVLQAVYTDQIRDDEQSRRRSRITPDALVHLPNHNAVCSWLSAGARVNSFTLETLPMEEDPARIAHHLQAQRARGAHPIDAPPPPRYYEGEVHHREAAVGELAETSGQRAAGPTANGTGSRNGTIATTSHSDGAASNGTQQTAPAAADGDRPAHDEPTGHTANSNGNQRPRARDDGQQRPAAAGQPATSEHDAAVAAARTRAFEPTDHALDESTDRVGVAPLGSAVKGIELPEGFLELEALEQPTGLKWERPNAPRDPDKIPAPRRDELEILAALAELRFLLMPQIGRRFMADKSPRTVQNRMQAMFQNGWVKRFHVKQQEGGQSPRVYVLTESGFKIAQETRGPRGPYIRPEATWRDPEVEDPRLVVHDLHAVAWLFAFERVAGPAAKGWRGTLSSRLEPPKVKQPGGPYRPMRPGDVRTGSTQRIRDLALEQFEPVHPDLRVNVELGLANRTFDVLIEMDRTRRASRNDDKFRRYDALVTGWALALDRYQRLGEPPIVVFVCENERKAREFVERADRLVTGCVSTAGVPAADWQYPGRNRMFFVCERDVHLGTLRGYRMPKLPPEVRKKQGERGCEPEQVEFVASKLLQRNRRATELAGAGSR